MGMLRPFMLMAREQNATCAYVPIIAGCCKSNLAATFIIWQPRKPSLVAAVSVEVEMYRARQRWFYCAEKK